MEAELKRIESEASALDDSVEDAVCWFQSPHHENPAVNNNNNFNNTATNDINTIGDSDNDTHRDEQSPVQSTSQFIRSEPMDIVFEAVTVDVAPVDSSYYSQGTNEGTGGAAATESATFEAEEFVMEPVETTTFVVTLDGADAPTASQKPQAPSVQNVNNFAGNGNTDDNTESSDNNSASISRLHARNNYIRSLPSHNSDRKNPIDFDVSNVKVHAMVSQCQSVSSVLLH